MEQLNPAASEIAKPTKPGTRISLILRLILGTVFLYSGGMKLPDLAAFQNEIAGFNLVSWKMAGTAALFLPWLEIICGIALITGKLLQGALFILSSLMLIFIAAVAGAWARGLDVTCGCFGSSNTAISYPWWIIRNLAILAGLQTILFFRRTNTAKSQPD